MSPCKDCPNRCPACSDTCTEYKAYKADLSAKKNWLNENSFQYTLGKQLLNNRYKSEKRATMARMKVYK